MTEKTPEKKRRGLTFPADPLAVMQMDEIDAMARRAENGLTNESADTSVGTSSAPKFPQEDHMASHMAENMADSIADSIADKTDGNTTTQQDRQTDGRPAGQMVSNITDSTAIVPDGNTGILPATHGRRVESDATPPPSAAPATMAARPGETGRPQNTTGGGVSQTDRESRFSKAMQVIEENDLVNITVRIPAKFNGFLDEYVDRLTRANPKRRYKKQDAIAEALALFIADHPMPAMPATQDDF